MTMTLAPPARDAALSEFRIPAIAANLLPDEIVESRRVRVIRRNVVSALVLLVLLLTAWSAMANYRATVAADRLTYAEQDVQRVVEQQEAFSEVVRIEAEATTMQAQLATLLADDLRWSTLLSSVQTAAPGGVQLTGVWGALSPEENGAPAATPAPDSADLSIGILTVSGSAPDETAVATYVDALAELAGVAHPLLSTATLKDGVVEFRVQVDITASALGGRHTADDGAGEN
jgi:Tfp pilus assembly protein PilN